MLSILTVILLLIVFLVLLVLFAAIDVVFNVKGTGVSVEHTVVVHWLLFSRQVSPELEDEVNDGHSDDDFPEEFKDAEKYVTEKVKGHFQESGEKEKKKKSIDMTYSEMIRTFRQLRTPVIRFIKGLIYAIKIPYARVNAVYGFPDPSYTGIACGYSHALMAYLACNFENLRVNLEPDFVDSRIEFDMSGKFRIRLYRFIPVILRFVFNRSVLSFSWSFFIKKYYRKSSGNL
ncbi:DUF2953 domain-containing protein [Methanolobus sediminis]|uniref:DUF2953 domain-containing protein n=1 Tax=Methanolobus sediminis TaxID=3072978 RepID=A0AA51UID5_9EURY|nr:DUF2953 domain-containing protein [Methanolobus sediminis]WMW23959.1 DUF2953 domain-containing protein [Methanolobus sediminis]